MWHSTENAIQETTPRLAVPDDGNGDLDPQAVAELRRLARSRPRSGREAVAKASALRTLERLNRGTRQGPPMPEGCSCMSTSRSCGAIGRWRGPRGECEWPRLLIRPDDAGGGF